MCLNVIWAVRHNTDLAFIAFIPVLLRAAQMLAAILALRAEEDNIPTG